MASAAKLLSGLGVPPRDVCLDWAWQLHDCFAVAADDAAVELTPQSTSDLANPQPANSNLATDGLAWEDIDVSSTGELRLQRTGQVASCERLVQQLVAWASHDEAFAREERIATSPAKGMNLTSSVDTESLPAEAAQSHISTTFADKNHASRKGSSKDRLSETRAERVASLVAAQLKKHWIAVSVVGVTLCICIAAIATFGTDDKRNSSIAEAKPKSESVDDRSAMNLPDENSEASDSNGKQDSVSDELLVMPSLDSVNESAVPHDPQAGMGVDLATLIPAQANDSSQVSPNIDRSPTNESVAKVDPQQTPPETGVSAVEATDSAVSVEVPDGSREVSGTDVMREVIALASNAESSVDSELNASSDNDQKVHDPFVLSTSPLMQTFKLPTKLNVRMKNPQWQIQLSVDSEFDLSPAEPQSISDKQLTTWFVTPLDAKAPKPRIVIQALAMPGRQAGLRWRVFAGSEDVPALMLPLSREVLPVIQQRVRIFASAAQVEMERLKQVAAMSPKEDRALLVKQRTALGAQLKLANRITEIAAEMKMLDDQLRNQVTVYATLRDGLEPDAPIALQFGDFEADHAAEAEQADKADSEKAKSADEKKEIQSEEPMAPEPPQSSAPTTGEQ